MLGPLVDGVDREGPFGPTDIGAYCLLHQLSVNGVGRGSEAVLRVAFVQISEANWPKGPPTHETAQGEKRVGRRRVLIECRVLRVAPPNGAENQTRRCRRASRRDARECEQSSVSRGRSGPSVIEDHVRRNRKRGSHPGPPPASSMTAGPVDRRGVLLGCAFGYHDRTRR